MNNFYIYFHIKPDINEVFYVGKGKDRRAWRKQGRSKHWNNIVKKYEDFEIKIMENNLTEEEAFEREKYWILKIGRIDLKNGPLINLTNGGEGGGGRIMPDEQKIKIGEFFKGKKLSEEHKKNISKGMEGTMDNRVFTQEHKDKLRKATIGCKRNCKKVKDLNTDKIYETVKEAHKELKLTIKYATLCLYLSGHLKNKTNLIYLI